MSDFYNGLAYNLNRKQRKKASKPWGGWHYQQSGYQPEYQYCDSNNYSPGQSSQQNPYHPGQRQPLNRRNRHTQNPWQHPSPQHFQQLYASHRNGYDAHQSYYDNRPYPHSNQYQTSGMPPWPGADQWQDPGEGPMESEGSDGYVSDNNYYPDHETSPDDSQSKIIYFSEDMADFSTLTQNRRVKTNLLLQSLPYGFKFQALTHILEFLKDDKQNMVQFHNVMPMQEKFLLWVPVFHVKKVSRWCKGIGQEGVGELVKSINEMMKKSRELYRLRVYQRQGSTTRDIVYEKWRHKTNANLPTVPTENTYEDAGDNSPSPADDKPSNNNDTQQEVIKKADLLKPVLPFDGENEQEPEYVAGSNWMRSQFQHGQETVDSNQYTPANTLKDAMQHNRRNAKILKALSKPVESTKAERMMLLMGWKGGALGTTGEGITEPIVPNIMHVPGAGLGHKPKPTPPPDRRQNRNQKSTFEVGVWEPVPKKPAKLKKGQNPTTKRQNHANFKTNTLLQILDFLKHDEKLEVAFENLLTNKERKLIHTIVDAISNGEDIDYDNTEQMEIMGEIQNNLDCFLYTESAGTYPKDRQLFLYKSASEKMYLITPEDLEDHPLEEIEANVEFSKPVNNNSTVIDDRLNANITVLSTETTETKTEDNANIQVEEVTDNKDTSLIDVEFTSNSHLDSELKMHEDSNKIEEDIEQVRTENNISPVNSNCSAEDSVSTASKSLKKSRNFIVNEFISKTDTDDEVLEDSICEPEDDQKGNSSPDTEMSYILNSDRVITQQDHFDSNSSEPDTSDKTSGTEEIDIDNSNLDKLSEKLMNEEASILESLKLTEPTNLELNIESPRQEKVRKLLIKYLLEFIEDKKMVELKFMGNFGNGDKMIIDSIMQKVRYCTESSENYKTIAKDEADAMMLRKIFQNTKFRLLVEKARNFSQTNEFFKVWKITRDDSRDYSISAFVNLTGS